MTLSRTSCVPTSPFFESRNCTVTIETPSIVVDRSSSMPETVLMMSSIGLVTEVSISSTLAPGSTVVTVQTGKSTFGKQVDAELAVRHQAQHDRDRDEHPGEDRPLDADVGNGHGIGLDVQWRVLRRPERPWLALAGVDSWPARPACDRCDARTGARRTRGSTTGVPSASWVWPVVTTSAAVGSCSPMTSTQPSPSMPVSIVDGPGLAVLDDEDLGHAGEVDDRLDRDDGRLARCESVTIDALAKPPGRSRPRSLGTSASTWNVRLAGRPTG